ncbi:MAG: hypothetical protein MRZ90_08305 [Candidatus Gastranaerophilales bacterium]|nr:hypothetical protein [Candidatus Gastranaerophilales bacterium]
MLKKTLIGLQRQQAAKSQSTLVIKVNVLNTACHIQLKTKNMLKKALIGLQRQQATKSQSTLVIEVNVLNARCLGLRRVRNYATPFHNFLQNCSTSFSSSQSGKANDESAVRHIQLKTKNMLKKALIGLQRNNQTKANPRW